MKKEESDVYLSPLDQQKLTLKINAEEKDIVYTGEFIAEDGTVFPIKNGIPDFTWPKELAEIDLQTRQVYDKLAQDYEKFASIPFRTFRSDESQIRTSMVDKLKLNPESIVLEIGCGDGRGSQYIASRLSKHGKMYLQELSLAFLNKAVDRLKGAKPQIEYSVANACYLPFPNNFFDAAHHFGGINTFSDVKRSLAELARVVKPGGKVVVGDESLGPWLRDSLFGKIMSNSNPLLKYEVPFKDIPLCARDVKIEWIMLGAFFLLEFTVGDGEPEADFHIMIPSERGGSHWTRYFGNLEGVSDEVKKLAQKAREKSGKSMHQWLDDVVREAAEKELKKTQNK